MEVDKDKTSLSKEELTLRNSLLFAAMDICEEDFPEPGELPRNYNIPFTNLGHTPFFNYGVYYSEVWAAANRLKSIVSKYKSISVWVIAFILILIMIITVRNDDYLIVYVSFSIMFIFIVPNLLLSAKREKLIDEFKKEKDEILLEIINKLSDLKLDDLEDTKFENNVFFATGTLGLNKTPVITILNNDEPFPGFGRMQLENSITCKLSDGHERNVSDLSQKILVKIKSLVESDDTSNLESGKVVVVHGDTIKAKSKWLQEDQSPILWLCNDNEVKEYQLNSEGASCRVYYGVQVLFGEHQTAVTFFFRLFYTSNSITCHVAMLTIGPPVFEKNDILKKLLQSTHERETTKSYGDNIEKLLNKDKQITKLDYLKAYEEIEGSEKLVGKINFGSISEIDEHISEKDQAKNSLYSEWFSILSEKSIIWPGSIGFKPKQIQEVNSYTFTTDFFGRPEFISGIKTAYQQVFQGVLDTFKEHDIDISDYRDKDGSYTINADKIDSLIVGEKVFMKDNKKNETQGKSEQ